MKGVVDQVFVASNVQPIVTTNEVGQFISSDSLDCGMVFDESSNRPILKIFNQHGGTVEEEDATKKVSSKEYVILRHKRSNKVSIYGVKTVFLKKPDYYKIQTYTQGDLANHAEEFNSTFRTKKVSRIIKARGNDAIETSTEIFGIIKPMTNDISQLSSSTTQIDEFNSYLPLGCNRFATNIEDVYPVSTLLSENEIDLMTDYANEVITMIPVPEDNEDLSKFFIANVNRLPQKNVQNICLLTLADALVTLLFLKSEDVNKNYAIYPNSELINSKVLDHFTEYSITGRDISSKMKDKAVCHIIIVMLLINMTYLDLSWISQFLPGKCQKRLIMLMRVVGATATKEDKTKFTLKIPLAALPTYQRTPKRKR
ncbi:uncharacterized protein LOC126844056 [Adelges cooleyi]|uniref:uncharacterized protein LOC126839701 n=1 Tax=Adelges cooleyi TaxID=133065 RepID=UPI00217FE117|nr:uncharacterized protein LOC126839701 [Adelges cooleyi]XP_050437862.1 uncharacterized protein LOC126844056 [Adelges cooleyi]